MFANQLICWDVDRQRIGGDWDLEEIAFNYTAALQTEAEARP